MVIRNLFATLTGLRRWIATSWLCGFAATPLLAMTGFGGMLCCFCLTKPKPHDNILAGKPEHLWERGHTLKSKML